MDSGTLKKLETAAGLTLGKAERERFLKNSELNLKVIERAGSIKTGDTAPYGQTADTYTGLRDDKPKVSVHSLRKKD
ncbi:MAG: hypothetical protein IJL87_08415 [Clostridia bacterium]|nr:hypothetical protein [Clostridia bacterium]